jgi:hypothetical protein
LAVTRAIETTRAVEEKRMVRTTCDVGYGGDLTGKNYLGKAMSIVCAICCKLAVGV